LGLKGFVVVVVVVEGKLMSNRELESKVTEKRATRATVQDDRANSYFGSYKGSLSLVEVFHL